ncbi:MAG: MarR family transcriptional regulator [Ruminococcaceae bacterium]|nr:MarR family transcriptional regulator [Oscillospiraceae bacterium]
MRKESISEIEAKATVHKLIVTMKKHKKLFDEMREQTGLGRTAHRMLMILSDTEPSPSQTFLADRLEISTAAVAVMLKKMENEGYILRKVSQTDSRFNSIELTEKGVEIVETSKKAFYSIDTSLFAGFSAEEVSVLNDFLDRIQTNITEIERR